MLNYESGDLLLIHMNIVNAISLQSLNPTFHWISEPACIFFIVEAIYRMGMGFKRNVSVSSWWFFAFYSCFAEMAGESLSSADAELLSRHWQVGKSVTWFFHFILPFLWISSIRKMLNLEFQIFVRVFFVWQWIERWCLQSNSNRQGELCNEMLVSSLLRVHLWLRSGKFTFLNSHGLHWAIN